MGEINAFIDHGFGEASTFARALFDSPDFTVPALRSILHTGANLNKTELAGEVWNRLSQGDLNPSTILYHWVTQPRRWLSFKLGTISETPTLGSATELLTNFGEDGWHGPIQDPENPARCWYIHINRIFHFRLVDHQPRLSHARWTVVAEVTDKYLALTWKNFSRRPGEGAEETERYPFWQHIPEIFSDLESHLGNNKWQSIALHQLVLHDLWTKYGSDSAFRWHHLRIRAERYGVALSARSARVSKLDVSGLEALTRALAASAAEAGGLTDKPYLVRKMEAELLRTLLIEFGANSYGCQLDRNETNDQPRKILLKAHFYFGLRTNLQTQDRLQHIECSHDSGGTSGVLAFLLSNIS